MYHSHDRLKDFGIYSFDKVYSLLAISSGTFCNNGSNRHTRRIYGKVNLGVEFPFVRLISWLPPFAPTA